MLRIVTQFARRDFFASINNKIIAIDFFVLNLLTTDTIFGYSSQEWPFISQLFLTDIALNDQKSKLYQIFDNNSPTFPKTLTSDCFAISLRTWNNIFMSNDWNKW